MHRADDDAAELCHIILAKRRVLGRSRRWREGHGDDLLHKVLHTMHNPDAHVLDSQGCQCAQCSIGVAIDPANLEAKLRYTKITGRACPVALEHGLEIDGWANRDDRLNDRHGPPEKVAELLRLLSAQCILPRAVPDRAYYRTEAPDVLER